MNTQIQHQPSLKTKLTTILSRVDEYVRQGASLNFGMLRNMLGQQRVMILPSVKNYTEHPAPNGQSRVTVVLEVALLDGESDDQMTTRWVGQAIDAPEVCYEHAITSALEDFLQKTFLVIAPNAHRDEAVIKMDNAPTPVVQTSGASDEPTSIRRKPQGASSNAPVASPGTVMAQTNTESEPEEPSQQSIFEAAQQLDTSDGATAEEQPQETAPESYADQKAWKAANALWRALVSEVCSADVMEIYEVSLEHQHGVDSWKKISPETIRQWCATLRRRSSMPSDIRKLSDREEYILSQLPSIPRGSSLDRVEEEMRRLALEVVSVEEVDAFQTLYLQKMNVEGLEHVAGRALVAMCRKLRRLKSGDREAFILDALGSKQAA